ncbi:hypothetical protein PVAND_010850 [Polypedilum vanderplanki]|uniref:Protein kinase domain-containing protein n=1 Tax=Polypedilum vanderplanki TaxID=319348 RepID=A0A9J6CH92_POLVA|nr:hypothetical protein PVAND_010850 [Polypedilum vanderplanki]
MASQKTLIPLSTCRIIAFGKYQLTGKKFGEGSFSKVREAHDTEKKMTVALKITDTKNLSNDYIERSCMREAQILAKINHFNIVKMFDCFKASSRYVLVLEVVPINLCDFIEQQHNSRLKEVTCRSIFRQIVAATAYLHKKDIIHRDIKLENILLDPKTFIAKLTDFGLSTEWSNKDERLKTNCGSPEYSAPELHEGLKYTNAVDIWALGVVLFAMIVGRLPFDISNKRPVSVKHRRELFLEEIKFGIKTRKHQSILFSATSLVKDLLSLMLNPDFSKRIQIDKVEQHKWLMFKTSVNALPTKFVNKNSTSSQAAGRAETTIESTPCKSSTNIRPVTRVNMDKPRLSTKKYNCI